MPSCVIWEKCDGCQKAERTACMYICPNDLMVLDREVMKAYNQEPDLCWECYNCVKICPQQAIVVRGYADFMPLGSSVIPLRGTDSIMWTCKYRDGTMKRFKFAIRTTPEGSIEPYADYPPMDRSKIDDLYLYSEPDTLMGKEIPLPPSKK